MIKNKILITGGTGLIGKVLQKKLLDNNNEVVILSRNPKKENEFRWDISKGYIDDDAFNGVTHIIHLAGAGIADKRWSLARKKELIDSRVKSANLLFKKIKELQIDLKGFVSASGIGYYGAITSDKVYAELDKPANDFISKVCVAWEKSAHQFKQINVPVTILRTGIVLTKKGGALEKINTPLLLSVLGKGNQYLPWIHIDDLCNLYLKPVESNDFTGVFNAVSPAEQTYFEFVKKLSKSINKKIFPINAPSFILKIILGKMSSILLKGSRISSEKTASKYSFLYPDLSKAFKDLYQ